MHVIPKHLLQFNRHTNQNSIDFLVDLFGHIYVFNKVGDGNAVMEKPWLVVKIRPPVLWVN